MAFNKVFIILALTSCVLAMPLQSVEVESTPVTIDAKVETSTAVQEQITTVVDGETVTGKKEATPTDSTVKTEVDQVVAKRSTEEESSGGDDDLETAAGTNVLRPLFVYRQQVAYRQRVRNANRRGNRRF